MATIRKRGHQYQVQIRRTGFSSISRSFYTLSDAKEWARLKEREADRLELGPSTKALATITLGELVERYKENVTPTKKGAKTEGIMLTAFLRSAICKKPLSQLTVSDFSEFRDKRMKSVKPVSIRRQLMTIRAVLTVAAIEWDVPLRTNPLAELKLNVGRSARERRLRAGEFDQLRGAIRADTNPYLWPYILFAIETAMRRSEVLSLRWHDVDIERRLILVQDAKNGFGRPIPITDVALDVLRVVASLSGTDKPNPEATIFPLNINTLAAAWKNLTKRAKVFDFRLHDLRHEAISRLFEKGLTAPEVASISGHRTLSQLSRYAHASNESVRAKLGIAASLGDSAYGRLAEIAGP